VSRLLGRAEVKKIFFDNPEAVLGDRQIRVHSE
jgi:hypothetical protein